MRNKYFLIIAAIICSVCFYRLFIYEPYYNRWPPGFSITEFPSSLDGKMQKAYYYKATGSEKQPLVVSLHPWSGTYKKFKSSAGSQTRQKNWNFIHPNFRGPNWRPKACVSQWALNDIDDSIDWALENLNADPNRIYVIGNSGGGYATLAMFMRSRHNIKGFSAWVPISDLVAWYRELATRNQRLMDDILKCTESTGAVLDIEKAKARSPLHWPTPGEKLKISKLQIFTGIHDGHVGTVPITHSINFYNKILFDLGVEDDSAYVSEEDVQYMLTNRSFPEPHFGKIGKKTILYKKSIPNLELIIFDGGHQILEDYVLDLL